MNKKNLVSAVVDILENKIAEIEKAIENVQASVNEETKSSMGDKYEVGRVMAQNEREMLEVQLGEHKREMEILNTVNFFQNFDEVRLGALTETSMGKFLIGVSLGKITFEGESIMLISPNSPIGKELIGKTLNQSFDFKGKPVKIFSVI
ncbi:MAG: 3-oxoacyl-ACP synthase [Bacteroidetes bacterium]|nr:3-oxoacyl-ACP synthase [Bacteroidota bacterium]